MLTVDPAARGTAKQLLQHPWLAGEQVSSAPLQAAQHHLQQTRAKARCGAVRCGAVRCGAVRCGAVRCGACGARRCKAVQGEEGRHGAHELTTNNATPLQVQERRAHCDGREPDVQDGHRAAAGAGRCAGRRSAGGGGAGGGCGSVIGRRVLIAGLGAGTGEPAGSRDHGQRRLHLRLRLRLRLRPRPEPRAVVSREGTVGGRGQRGGRAQCAQQVCAVLALRAGFLLKPVEGGGGGISHFA
jgi:hypothetical protein